MHSFTAVSYCEPSAAILTDVLSVWIQGRENGELNRLRQNPAGHINNSESRGLRKHQMKARAQTTEPSALSGSDSEKCLKMRGSDRLIQHVLGVTKYSATESH